MTELSRVPGTQTCGAGKTRGPSAGGCRHPLRAAGFPLGGHRPGSLPLSGHQQDTGGEPGHTLCGPALSSPNSSLFPTGSPYRQHGWREPGDWGAAAPATQGAGGADSPLCRASRQDGRRGSCGDRHAEASPRHGPGQASSQTGFPRREWAARRRACATAADPSPASANAAPRSAPGARGGRTRTPLSRRSGNSDAARGVGHLGGWPPRQNGNPGVTAGDCSRQAPGASATALTVFHSAVPGLFPPRIKMMDSRAGGRMHTCSQVGPLQENKEWSQEGDQGDLHCDFNALEKICPNVNTRYFWEVGMWSLASRHLNCCLPEKNSTI